MAYSGSSELSDGLKSARAEQETRLRRFYVEQPLAVGTVLQLDGNEGRHLVKVLRCRVGDRVELADGSGRLVSGEVTAVDRNRASVVAMGELRHEPWAGPCASLVVACGTLKGGRSDWLVEKATELGAWCLVPLLTERAPSLGADGEGKGDGGDGGGGGRERRWARVASAALKQSLRTHALQIARPQSVSDLAEQIRGGMPALLAAAGGEPLLKAVERVRARRRPEKAGADDAPEIVLIVGPEGDFTEGELDELIGAGAIAVSLGPLRLRVETAALALLAGTQLHWNLYDQCEDQ